MCHIIYKEVFIMSEIIKIVAREVLDSRANPTVEVEVYSKKGGFGRAIVPSGASTGKREALELRDGENRYLGKGVSKAINYINTIITPKLIGLEVTNQSIIDQVMLELDGTENKSKLGANAILGVSMAVACCAANELSIPLYRYLGGINAHVLPVPMMNILNGGAHAGNNIDIQEMMIIPINAPSFKEGLRMCVEVYHTLKKCLAEDHHVTSVGDEGGFAPNLKNEEEAFDYIIQAIQKAGYHAGKDFKLALDIASSEWKTAVKGVYELPKSKLRLTSEALIMKYEQWLEKYPICSIEDGLDEEDKEGWKLLTQRLGSKIQLVGDDLFVTNKKLLKDGIENGIANAILIKLNQIGTVSETLEAIEMARKAGYGVIVSHRSGETEDTFIASLAVATNAGQIKTGAPSRSERVAKYNELLRIEEYIKNLP